MSKEEKSLIPVKKENFISRIFKFIKNIFVKEKVNDVNINTEIEKTVQGNSNKKDFIKNISFRENEETNKIIEDIKKDKSILYNMDIEELDNINERIKEKQKFMNKKIETLKTEIQLQKKINSSLN